VRQLLRTCGQRKWQLLELDSDPHNIEHDQVVVTMTLSGLRIKSLDQVLGEIEGVIAVLPGEDEPDYRRRDCQSGCATAE
jgi:hypothetical protein